MKLTLPNAFAVRGKTVGEAPGLGDACVAVGTGFNCASACRRMLGGGVRSK